MSQPQILTAMFIAFFSFASSFEVVVLKEYCECSIHVSIMAEPMDASKLLNHMFNDHPKPVKCNENGYLECQNYCYHKVGQITNGFTLAKPLTNAEGSDVAFGQLMCGLIGKNMDGATVSLRPHFYCQEMRGVYDFDTTNLKAYPGQQFTEKLNCQDGKFS